MSGAITFQNPIIVKSLDLPGPGAAGSETPTMGGTVIVITTPSSLGAAKLTYLWETWSVVVRALELQAAGTIFSITFEGYSGNAKFPTKGGISWSPIAGNEAPQSEIVGTALDLYSGELTLILLGSS